MSTSATRSPAQLLAGQSLSGNAYVFVSPESGISRADFYLDDPNRSGAPRQTERNAPWDFAGTASDRTAIPWDTTRATNGSHTITAAITPSAGGTQLVNATFTVSNGAPTPAKPDQVHLAWVEDPSTTLTVTWRTRLTSTPSEVEYRPLGSTEWRTATGSQRPSGTSGKLHEATLRSLSPSTTYEYRVRGDEQLWSDVLIARTAPPPGPADFDVVYVADTGLIGRSDGLATGTEQVRDEIAKLNPLLVLPGGDYAYYDTDKRYGTLDNTIDAWFNQMQPVAARSPMLPTYGNHEVLLGEGYDAWAARFPTPTGHDGRRNYSFDIGDVHFVSILAVQESTGLTSGQLSWIEQDIQAAKAAGKRWIVPYYHVSPFSDGTNHRSNLELRRQLGPLFERLGVKVALSSHDQAYERTWPLRDVPATNTPTSSSKTCYTASDGVTWVKISPGGKLSNISKGFSPFGSEPAPSWTAFRDNTAHVFGRLRVYASGILRFDAYFVKGDGSPPQIRDSFEYRLGGCPDTTPPPAPVASPPAGTYSTAQSVTLTSEPGARIHYTANGSTPTTASPEYTSAIAVTETQVIKAIAVDAAGNQSAVAAHAYTIDPNASSSYAEVVLSTPGLVSFWRLAESSGAFAGDAKGANPGSYINGVLLGQPGALAADAGNTAARFDGSNDYVSVPDASSLDTSDRFTLEAWVRRTSTSSTGTHRIMSKGDGSYTFGFSHNVLTLRKQASADVVRANIATTDTATFHHMVATKDGPSVRLYIDGVDVTDAASVPSSVPVIANTTSPLNLGRATNGTAYLPAVLDEVAIYSVALSGAQVAQHFQAGRG